MSSRISLKEQITRRLQNILNYYVIGTALLIFMLALVIIWVLHLRQLEQYEALISTKLSSELTALIREADFVGNSSVVWNGLTDSAGRETYLEPLLERINRNSSHPIDLLDYRGRDYIVSKKAHGLPRMSAAGVERTIQTAAAQTEIQITPDGQLLFVSLPVVAPFSEGVLGIMLVHVNLNQELEELRLPADLRIRYDLRNSEGVWPRHSWFTHVVDVPVRLDKFDVPLRVAIGQPV